MTRAEAAGALLPREILHAHVFPRLNMADLASLRRTTRAMGHCVETCPPATLQRLLAASPLAPARVPAPSTPAAAAAILQTWRRAHRQIEAGCAIARVTLAGARGVVDEDGDWLWLAATAPTAASTRHVVRVALDPTGAGAGAAASTAASTAAGRPAVGVVALAPGQHLEPSPRGAGEVVVADAPAAGAAAAIAPTGVAWAPDGTALVATADGRDVLLRDGGRTQLPLLADAFDRRIRWAPTSDRLALIWRRRRGELPQVTCFDACSGAALATLAGLDLHFGPDATTALVRGIDGLRLLRLADGAVLAALGADARASWLGGPEHLLIAADDGVTTLVAGDEGARPQRLFVPPSGSATALYGSPDGAHAVICAPGRTWVVSAAAAAGRPRVHMLAVSLRSPPAFSPRGERLLLDVLDGAGPRLACLALDAPTLGLVTLALPWRHGGRHQDLLPRQPFSPSGQHLAVQSGGCVAWARVSDGAVLGVAQRPRPHGGAIADRLRWSADGSRLVTPQQILYFAGTPPTVGLGPRVAVVRRQLGPADAIGAACLLGAGGMVGQGLAAAFGRGLPLRLLGALTGAAGGAVLGLQAALMGRFGWALRGLGLRVARAAAGPVPR